MRLANTPGRIGYLATLCGALLAIATHTRADEPEPKKPAETEPVKLQDITLAVPKTWKQSPPANRLRLGQFEIPATKDDKDSGELVVSFFGGGGGGADANIERWIGQFQPQGREVKITRGTSKQGEYIVVDLSGTYNKPVGPPIRRKTVAMPDARMIAVILAVEGKGNYFLKFTGPKKTISANAEDIRHSFGGDAKSEKPYAVKDAA